MIKAIVFDAGGVLLRTEDYTGRRYLEEKYHLSKGESDKIVFLSAAAKKASLGEVGSNAVWDHVAKQLKLDHDQLIDFQEKFWGGDQIDKNLINFIKILKNDYVTALLSNAWKNFRSLLFNIYDIKEGETFDHILISAELGIAKPDPRIYDLLSQTLQCDFKEILFIDDFIENINAASELGIRTILYTPNIDLINEIKSKLE